MRQIRSTRRFLIGFIILGSVALAAHSSGQGITGADTIITIAGTGMAGYSGDDGPATAAELNQPANMAVDRYGRIFIADEANSVVRMIDTSGIITTVAGNGYGHGGPGGYSGDGGPATNAQMLSPCDIAFDRLGNMFIADFAGNAIRKVDTNNIITTLPVGAYLRGPSGLAFDSKGDLYIVDQRNDIIWQIDTLGITRDYAGNGTSGSYGDGGLANDAAFDLPADLAFDKDGNLYVSDQYNYTVRQIDSAGLITRFAGITFFFGYTGDGGPAIDAELYGVAGVAADTFGNVYIADIINNVVRKVDQSGIISTVVGNGYTQGFYGAGGYRGDGGPATACELNSAFGLKFDHQGNLLVADSGNNVVRKVIRSRYLLDTKNTANPVLQPTLYPNPVTSELIVENAAGMELTIYDIMGLPAYKIQVTTIKQAVDISAISPGVYLATFMASDGRKKSLKVTKI